MAGTHEEQLIDHLRVFLVFIEFNFFIVHDIFKTQKTEFLGDYFISFFVVELYQYLFNIHSFIHTIFFVYCGEV